ncbi:ras guanine nucleotide exchange factor domain-containing protein [Cladochytrium replicatum]|nr:ras guanine nucleotide exchange factor domain-containing protein [Cladochytrium replicatum]
MQIVAAGPIDSLLDALIFPLINDMSYAEVFFATYRFFLSPSHVLASLIKWYNVVLPTIVPGSPGYPQLRKSEGFERTQSQMVFYRRHRKYIQARAIKCMLLWVTNHWLDFQTNPGMLSELQSFVNEISSVSFGDSQKISHAIREQRLSWYTLQYISPFPPRFGTYIPTPYGCINEEAGIGNIPGHSAGLSSAQNSAGPSAAAIAAAALAMTTGMSPTTHPPPQWALPTHQQLQTRPWISVWEPEWFAQQITLVDHFLYRQIRPDSYLHLLHNPVGVAGAGRDQGLKVILDAVEWFRLVSLYTGSVILNEDGQKRRSKMIKRFIKVVKEARRLRNYSLVFAVVHGLRLPAVARLSSAWEGLPTKYLDMFKELSAVTEPQGGFANYWAELRLTQPPAVPYLAAYIHDLMEIHEEAPVYLTGRSYSPSLPTPGTTGTDSRPISPSSEYSHTSHVTQSSHATSHTSTTNPHSTHTGYSATSEGSEGDSVLGQIINFRKFYSLYSIVAEMEVFRTSSYREPGPLFSLAPTTNSSTDSSAQVLQQTQNNGSPSSVSGLVGAIPPSPFSLPVADKDALSYLVTHVKDYLSRSDEVLEWFETQPQSDASQRGTFGRAMKRMSSLLALQKRGSSPLPQESSDVGEDVYE